MADPEAWGEYVGGERDEWLDADLTDLSASASEEYPEYNQRPPPGSPIGSLTT